MAKREGLFRVSGNNKGLMCPFKMILCQEGYCTECQIYLDWQKKGEAVLICTWCSRIVARMPSQGWRSVVCHGICPECKQKYFSGLEVMKFGRAKNRGT